MSHKRSFCFIVTVAILSAVLGAYGFAQNAGAVAESPRAGTTNAQQGFRITPVRPIAKLRAEALKATPPEEHGSFRASQLVEIKSDSTIHLDIRYSTSNNFLGEPVYEQARAFLQIPAALALRRASKKLQEKGYGLLVYDAYRPWYVTKIFWDATPMDKREFVADPAKGSIHNRGCAVDLTLYDLKTGAAVAMPSEYDEMTPRAYADYEGANAEEKEHRATLRVAMESEGFIQRPNEWWHYDYQSWQRYGIVNLPLDRVPETVHLVGEGVTSPKVLKRSDPQFSEEATLKHIEGKVLLTVVVGEDGKTRDIQVERGPGYGLDEASVEAIQKWTFEPGKVDGVASAVALSVETSFRVSLRTPKVVRRVDPEFARPGAYPRVKGKILVTLTVDENGLPTNIKVEHSAGKHIDEEAIEAVRQWRFEPGTKDGVAVPMPYDIEFLRF